MRRQEKRQQKGLLIIMASRSRLSIAADYMPKKNLLSSTNEGMIGNNQLLVEQSAAANMVGASSKDILPYILLVGFLGILLMGSAAIFSDSFNPKPISLESK